MRTGIIRTVSRWFGPLQLVLLALLTLGVHSPVSAHKSGDAYLNVSGNSAGTIELRFVMALKDWDTAEPGLDADDNRQLSWAEVQQALPALRQRTAQELDVICGQRTLSLDWQFEGLERRTDGAYTLFRAQAVCPVASQLSYRFRLMSALDPTHRLLVSEQRDGRDSLTVLSGETPLALVAGPNPNISASVNDPAARSGQRAGSGAGVFPMFFREGLLHLFAGYDHMAFLLALILPLTLRSQERQMPTTSPGIVNWRAPDAPTVGLYELITIVTCFTLGHSLTLALAVIGGLSVDSQWVEPLIALSIAVSALMNLGWLRQWHRRWVAIGFGLIHGLGFSSSLQALQSGSASTFWALAGFNLGVEAGQLFLVLIWCAVTYVLDRRRVRRGWLVPAGSWSLFVAGLVLAIQRVVFNT